MLNVCISLIVCNRFTSKYFLNRVFSSHLNDFFVHTKSAKYNYNRYTESVEMFLFMEQMWFLTVIWRFMITSCWLKQDEHVTFVAFLCIRFGSCTGLYKICSCVKCYVGLMMYNFGNFKMLQNLLRCFVIWIENFWNIWMISICILVPN